MEKQIHFNPANNFERFTKKSSGLIFRMNSKQKYHGRYLKLKLGFFGFSYSTYLTTVCLVDSFKLGFIEITLNENVAPECPSWEKFDYID